MKEMAHLIKYAEYLMIKSFSFLNKINKKRRGNIRSAKSREPQQWMLNRSVIWRASSVSCPLGIIVRFSEK